MVLLAWPDAPLDTFVSVSDSYWLVRNQNGGGDDPGESPHWQVKRNS